MNMVGQDIWVSFMQLSCLHAANGILIFVCRAVLLGVSRILDGAGELQLLIGRDKYSISSTVGDEPLNPEHRTALIMPICLMKTLPRFAGLRATQRSVKKPQAAPRISDDTYHSDGYNPDICVAEQKGVRWSLSRGSAGRRPNFYRRRLPPYMKRKAAMSFCRRWGNQYPAI